MSLLALALAGLAAAAPPPGPPPPELRQGERPIQMGYLAALPRTFGAAGLDALFDAARTRPIFHMQPARQEPPIRRQAQDAAPAPAPSSPLRDALRAAPAAWPPRRALLVPEPEETRAYRRTFRNLLANPEATDRYDRIILKYSQKYGLNPRLLKAIVAAESEFVRKATSPKGALGLMQLMAGTAREMGVAPERLDDPEQNIRAGASYLRHLFARAWRRYRLGNRASFAQAPLWLTQRVIAAYNAGPRFLSRDRLFRETRDYIRKVILFMRTPVTVLRRHRPAAPPERFPARDRL